jgi:hypothetical protein
MQDREPITPGHIWLRDVAGSALPRQPAGLSDILSRNRDDVLVLREPYGDRARPIVLATMALAGSFLLGWAGALNWPEVANLLGVGQIAQIEAPSPRIAEARSGSKVEGVRKTASTSDVRTAAPATVGSIPKPPATASGGTRLPADPPGTVFASPTNTSPAGMTLAARPPLAPAPETRPTTIPGWTVVEVRDGTAVLEGPDGIRMAARGDTIPGIGRIESIVRWGNRWIVATAHGLIATQ